MYTFRKEERLCNKRLLEELFPKGSSFLCYPFRVSWRLADAAQTVPVQVVFPVPKKRYKHAVDRNLIRRRMREAYRLQKQQNLYDILNQANIKLTLSLSYIGKEIEPYQLMEKKMLKMFAQLCELVPHESAKQIN
ncbi:ribonuclease P protein component [Mucilaginibacter polytrichastri]|uniref:Ribonuclease P protein component n=1 Tax=Mucilaginibacter polytrichastri TaxID=1302689 RepID=A0A1Q5ZZQ5_9SPHI|nr:ribonuclease P protein component [Mucilaginibacter polytrichastri]OKS87229.1 Ribonuclease P protein component [Mucilaginibacter polytrichastri]SFT18914.1 ribonuclease P protein component [Mucilaginibacter polytrichastri]